MEIGQKRTGNSDSDAPAAKKPVFNFPIAGTDAQIAEVPRPEPDQIVISPKQFVLKHTFQHVSSMIEGGHCTSPLEDHFGLNLCVLIGRCDGYLVLYLGEKNAPRQWHVSMEVCLRIFGRIRHEVFVHRNMEDPSLCSIGWLKFCKWESISDYLTDENLVVEFAIRINETAKIGKKILRSFGANMKDVSDVILVVRNQKFYASKYTLSAHSTYFKSLFLGSYKEAHLAEIILNGVDPFDIQNYLEFLYLQSSISDDTVEGLLLLSDQFDTDILKEKCEEFLVKDSKKSLKKKFKMFLLYNCDMEKIINEIRTYNDYKEVMAGENISQMNPKLMSQLIAKSVSF